MSLVDVREHRNIVFGCTNANPSPSLLSEAIFSESENFVVSDAMAMREVLTTPTTATAIMG